MQLLTFCDGSEISVNKLHADYPKEGRNNLNVAIENLKDYGYIKVTKGEDDMIWNVTDTPDPHYQRVEEEELEPEPVVAEEVEEDPDDKAYDQANEVYKTFSPDVKAAVNDWLAYKKERNQRYKPVGLRNLMSQLKGAVDEFGEAAVIRNVRNSIASHYQGITFDKMSSLPATVKSSGASRYDWLKEVDLE